MAPGPRTLERFDARQVRGLPADTRSIPERPGGLQILPLRRRAGRLFVDVTLGQRRTDVVLDWGSETTLALMPRAVLRSAFRLSDARLASSTVEGQGEMRLGVAGEVGLGEHVFRDLAFAIAPNDYVVRLGPLPVYRARGLLGLYPLASYGRFGVDLGGPALYLGALPPGVDSDAHVTVALMGDDAVTIEASLEGERCELKVDIGGDPHGWVNLRGAAARRFVATHETVPDGYATAVGETDVERHNGWLGQLEIGACTIRQVPLTAVLSGDAPADADGCVGSLGERFFGATQVAVDWEAKTLTFEGRFCGGAWGPL